jgi:hypothetical protein
LPAAPVRSVSGKMKPLIVALAGLWAGCATPNEPPAESIQPYRPPDINWDETIANLATKSQRRREDYVAAHPSLPEPRKAAIREGQVEIGMSIEEIAASWGEPERKSRDSDGYELWHSGPITLVFRDGKLIRWHDYNAK